MTSPAASRLLRLFVLVVAFLPACGSAFVGPETSDPSVGALAREAGDTVSLELGESARFEVEDVEVTFHRLVADSRCPADVTCVWEGDAEVRVLVVTDDHSENLSLHTTLEPRSVAVGSLSLELLEVLPHPVSDPRANPAIPRILIRLIERPDDA